MSLWTLAFLFPCITALRFQLSSKEGLTNKTSPFELFLKNDKSDVKLVFFAGVEGSGHHLLEAVLPHIDHCKVKFAPKSWDCWEGEWQRSEFNQFVDQLKGLALQKKCKTYVLPTAFSYPMCKVGGHDGRMKYDHPRLDWIHEAVSQVKGVQLHVIQLQRDMDDCLAANCIQRDFEPCDKEAETLEANGVKLAEHLGSLKSNERSCFLYGEPETMAKAIVESFGAEYKEVIEQVYQEHPSKVKRDDIPRWAEHTSKLQPVQEKLRKICKESEPIHLQFFKKIGA